MVLKDLLSISGQPGLFKYISQGRSGVIVENIETKKRMNIPASAKMSSLEDIAIFTEDEEVPLAEVMDKIFEKENGNETISHKIENEKLKKYMEEILPEYDRERVYVSDMKKLIQWYNLLQKQGMLIKEEEKEEDEKGKDDQSEKNPITEEEKKEEKQSEVDSKKENKPVNKESETNNKTNKKQA